MSIEQLDVTGIGNAIVDVLSLVSDDFLSANDLVKGSMQLIDQDQARALYAKMEQGLERSGGSAGNTMAGIASLGGTGAYIGKVARDALGDAFASDMRAVGMRFDTAPLADGAPTARCLVFVTPDAQRTMSTFLGASVELGPEDLDVEAIRSSRVTYLEGYLWDPPRAKEAFLEAARIAHEAGRKVALSLSDAFCVDRHRDSFRELVDGHVDILFANETEIQSLYQTRDFNAALDAVRGQCDIAALTRSEKGSLVVTRDGVVEAGAAPVAQVVDTTGAGDLYAAGFLFGYTRARPLGECARLGGVAAAEVISHFGARPEIRLSTLL